MGRTIIFLIAGVLLLIAETTLSPPLLPGGLPELHILLVMYLALQGTLLFALAVLAPLALILDAVSGVLPGYHVVFCTVSFLTIHLLVQRNPWLRISPLRMPLLGINYLLVSGLLYLILAYFKPDTMRPWPWLLLLTHTIILLLLAGPFFRFFQGIEHKTRTPSFTIKVFDNGNRRRNTTWDSGR